MNAAAVKRGWVMAGRDGAREWLERFWLRLTGLDGAVQRGGDRLAARRLAVAGADRAAARVLARRRRRRRDHPGAVALPVQPDELPPAARRRRGDARLRRASARRRARSSSSTPPTSATASRGSSSGDEITTDAILASACLPTLYQAIEIDDPKTGRREAYWDGGYTGNPALYPLFYRTKAPRHRHRPHQPALPRRAAAHLVGNRHAGSTRSASMLRCCASSATSTSSTG